MSSSVEGVVAGTSMLEIGSAALAPLFFSPSHSKISEHEMKFRKVDQADGNALIDWAEENGVEWEVWNPEEVLTDENALMELGLSEWPKSTLTAGETPPEWQDPAFERELADLEAEILSSF